MEVASKLISPAQMSVLKFSLSLHIYSPKVQMFEQIALERKLPLCQTVADVGGMLICDLDEMKIAVDKVILTIFGNYLLLQLIAVSHYFGMQISVYIL